MDERIHEAVIRQRMHERLAEAELERLARLLTAPALDPAGDHEAGALPLRIRRPALARRPFALS